MKLVEEAMENLDVDKQYWRSLFGSLQELHQCVTDSSGALLKNYSKWGPPTSTAPAELILGRRYLTNATRYQKSDCTT